MPAKKLGVTLMHEHIFWDWTGADSNNSYDVDDVAATILPYLLALKDVGCSTLVDATTCGAGRNVGILMKCAGLSGLNIITNTGAWDGFDLNGKCVPAFIKDGETDEIAGLWTAEFFDGIDGTKVKPGFIKVALGDIGHITPMQEKILRAAARTSINTGLVLQCHSFCNNSALDAVRIIEEEKMPYDRFIWVHADKGEMASVIELARRGIWVEFDTLARAQDFGIHLDKVEKMLEEGLEGRLLLSQDAGMYYYGEKNDESTIFPFSRILMEFLPLCRQRGIQQNTIDRLLVENPARALDII